MYSIDKTAEVSAAIADFSVNVQDPKAAILPTYSTTPGGQSILVIVVYDSPTAPPGIFDSFTNIPSVLSDLKTRSYLDLILTLSSNSTEVR